MHVENASILTNWDLGAGRVEYGNCAKALLAVLCPRRIIVANVSRIICPTLSTAKSAPGIHFEEVSLISGHLIGPHKPFKISQPFFEKQNFDHLLNESWVPSSDKRVQFKEKCPHPSYSAHQSDHSEHYIQ